MPIFIKKVCSTDELESCLAIRKKVFVDGQHISLAEEFDGQDAESKHYLLMVATDKPVGTARIRYVDTNAKVERVAILNDYQGQGLGTRLMQVILDDLKLENKVAAVKLSAQSYSIPFYEKLGFCICSDEYQEAGIPHKDMLLQFS